VAAGRKKCAAWDEAWQKALEKFGQRGALLALIGPQGTGKTVMATGLASRHRLWGSVVYTTLRALSLRMEKALRREAEGESRWDIYRELTECGLLVIDECGKGTDTPAELLLIVEIIDARYREERRTVLVSNHGDDPWTREGALEVFSAWAGASLVDRLMESGGPIACDWPSLREAQQ
jgi:DNA replication protein DnaC